jgi:hypothetical protein
MIVAVYRFRKLRVFRCNAFACLAFPGAYTQTLWPARQKRPQMASEAQRDNGEPDHDRGDAGGGNADPFPHSIRLAPPVATFGLYVGILRYRSGALHADGSIQGHSMDVSSTQPAGEATARGVYGFHSDGLATIYSTVRHCVRAR